MRMSMPQQCCSMRGASRTRRLRTSRLRRATFWSNTYRPLPISRGPGPSTASNARSWARPCVRPRVAFTTRPGRSPRRRLTARVVAGPDHPALVVRHPPSLRTGRSRARRCPTTPAPLPTTGTPAAISSARGTTGYAMSKKHLRRDDRRVVTGGIRHSCHNRHFDDHVPHAARHRGARGRTDYL